MVIAILVSNIVLTALLVWHVRGESGRQAGLVHEAFRFIKAGNLEEKVRTDALDVNLKQLAEVMPPQMASPDETTEEEEPERFADVLMRTGRAVDKDGDEWGIG